MQVVLCSMVKGFGQVPAMLRIEDKDGSLDGLGQRERVRLDANQLMHELRVA